MRRSESCYCELFCLDCNFQKQVSFLIPVSFTAGNMTHTRFKQNVDSTCKDVAIILYSPDLKRTTAFKQANSASPTWRLRKRALISCSIRMSAMVATIFSAGVLSTCIPAVARSGATSNGIFHWTAPMINNSLHPSSSRITWSRNGRFANEGMFLAHFTEINNRRAADSQMASGVEQYRDVASSCCGGYGIPAVWCPNLCIASRQGSATIRLVRKSLFIILLPNSSPRGGLRSRVEFGCLSCWTAENRCFKKKETTCWTFLWNLKMR